jgi:hypothetical protein
VFSIEYVLDILSIGGYMDDRWVVRDGKGEREGERA